MALLKTTALLFVYQIITFILGIFSDVVVSRSLGPEGRGSFYLILTTYTLAAGLIILGISYASTFTLAKKKATVKEVHTAVFMFIIGATLITNVSLWIIGRFLSGMLGEQLRNNFVIISFMVPLELYRQCWAGMMIGINRASTMARTFLFLTVSYLILMILFLKIFQMGLRGAFTVLIINGIISIGFMIINMGKQKGLFGWTKPILLKEMLLFGSIAHIGNATVQIYQRMGVYILSWMGNMSGVGYYTLAMSMAEKQNLALGAINAAANYRVIGEDRSSSEYLMSGIIRCSIVMLGMINIIALLCGRWVVLILYGKEFLTVVPLLMILFPGAAFLGLASILSNYFSGQLGRPSITSLLSVILLLISAPIYYLCIRYFGLIGAAYAISLVYLLHFCSLAVLFLKLSGSSLRDVFIIKRTDIIKLRTALKNIVPVVV
jgi:O-antigen/teichoic acid export membrane protein